MVQTTKGGVGNAGKTNPKAPKETAEDKKVERLMDLDDETWGRITSMATSQNRQPAEVVKSAIEQVYGTDNGIATHSDAFNAQ